MERPQPIADTPCPVEQSILTASDGSKLAVRDWPLAQAARATVARAADWTVPTLLLWAGDDRFVSPAGSRAFAAAAPACVQAQCFDALYHELFNESAELAAPVFARLRQWLDGLT